MFLSESEHDRVSNSLLSSGQMLQQQLDPGASGCKHVLLSVL